MIPLWAQYREEGGVTSKRGSLNVLLQLSPVGYQNLNCPSQKYFSLKTPAPDVGGVPHMTVEHVQQEKRCATSVESADISQVSAAHQPE